VHSFEFPLAEDVDATFLPSGEDQTVAELIPEFGGEDQPPFFIEAR